MFMLSLQIGGIAHANLRFDGNANMNANSYVHAYANVDADSDADANADADADDDHPKMIIQMLYKEMQDHEFNRHQHPTKPSFRPDLQVEYLRHQVVHYLSSAPAIRPLGREL